MHSQINAFRAAHDAHMDIYICFLKMRNPIGFKVGDEHPEIVRTAPTATFPAFERSVSVNDRIVRFERSKVPLY